MNIELRKHHLLLAIALAVNILALAPTLGSGFISDDVPNSMISGALAHDDSQLLPWIKGNISGWVELRGRFYPLSSYPYVLFYYIQSVLVIKIVVLAAILLSIYSFYRCLTAVSRNAVASSLAVLALPMLWQVRWGHDPLISFCGFLPVMSIPAFLSVEAFAKYLDNGRRRDITVAICLLVVATLTYELSYVFVVVCLMLAWMRSSNWRSALRKSMPLLAVTGMLMLMMLVLRMKATGLGAGEGLAYVPQVGNLAWLRAFLAHLTSGVPFSYRILNPHSVFGNPFGAPMAFGSFAIILTFFAFCVCYGKAAKLLLKDCHGGQSHEERLQTLALGGLLIILPAALTSVSPKFQALSFGDAYVPVYIQYFGWAAALGVLMEAACRWRGRLGAYVGRFAVVGFVVAASLLALSNMWNNWFVIHIVNQYYLYPRQHVENAAKRGIFDQLPPGSTLLVGGENVWSLDAFYTQLSAGIFYRQLSARIAPVYDIRTMGDADARRVAGPNCAPAGGQEVCELPEDMSTYALTWRYYDERTASVVVSKVSKVILSAGHIDAILSKQATVYVAGPDTKLPASIVLNRREVTIGEAGYGTRIVEDDKDGCAVLAAGNGWKRCAWRGEREYDALSVRAELSYGPAPSPLVWVKGPQEWLLPSDAGDVCHIGVGSSIEGRGYGVPIKDLGSTFTAEVVLNPSKTQVPTATILSNHPGSRNFQGLSIEQIGGNTNRYGAGFGSGKHWMGAGEFTLPGGVRSYLVMVVSGGTVRLYVNGQLVATSSLSNAIAESDFPLTIGNWINGDRLFAGLVEEVRISRRAVDEAYVAETARRLKTVRNLPKSPQTYLLQRSGVDVVHTGFDAQVDVVRLAPLKLPTAFSVELLVEPAKAQGPSATILSNHPGSQNYQGWSIEQLGETTNLYSIGFGSGKEWMGLGQFKLFGGRRNYVVISVEGRMARLYVNGLPVPTKQLPADIAESDLPFFIGNWGGGGRPFAGVVEEVRISKRAVDAKHVAETAARLKVSPDAQKAPQTYALRGAGRELIHAGFDDQADGTALGRIKLPLSFSIEMIVEPGEKQVPSATILSCHPGSRGYQGLSIEQMGGSTNKYGVGFGSGKHWMGAGEFTLPKGRKSYVALSVDRGTTRLYLNGSLIATRRLEAPIVDSDFPLLAGNWFAKSRPFHGFIEEVRITEGAVDENHVTLTARRLKSPAAPGPAPSSATVR